MQYITAALAPGQADKIKRSTGAARITKALIKSMAADKILDPVEFVSTSNFHRPGAWFTLPEAVKVYGPVGIQVRIDTAVVMIETDGTTVTVR